MYLLVKASVNSTSNGDDQEIPLKSDNHHADEAEHQERQTVLSSGHSGVEQAKPWGHDENASSSKDEKPRRRVRRVRGKNKRNVQKGLVHLLSLLLSNGTKKKKKKRKKSMKRNQGRSGKLMCPLTSCTLQVKTS
jgi:hypothetical protein